MEYAETIKFCVFARTTLADLLAQLRALDIAVPLKGEGHEKEHCEQYMMARFLATAARAGRLAFPLDVVHRERPDFLLRLADTEIGVECVEAVPREHRHIEAIREKHYPEAMNFGQRFEPGKETLSLDEKHDIASGRRAGRPWPPATAKRNWVSAMLSVVERKTVKLRGGNYASIGSTWLLIQDEWPNSLRFYPQQVRAAAAELFEELAPVLAPSAFQAVFIASGEQLLCFGGNELTVEEVCNLWA